MSLFDAPMTDPASEKRRQRLADDFRVDEQVEHLARLRKENPQRFDEQFGPRGQIMIGTYETQKQIAQERGLA